MITEQTSPKCHLYVFNNRAIQQLWVDAMPAGVVISAVTCDDNHPIAFANMLNITY